MLSTIFKAYDIRGIYPDELNEEVAFAIGRAFVRFLNAKKIVVGTDMRISSPQLSAAFVQGATEQGASVLDIGQVSTDALYFASGHLQLPGVMFTASHNPTKYNGMKFCKEGAVPVNEDTGLNTMRDLIQNDALGEKATQRGNVEKHNILAEYVKHVHSFIDGQHIRKMKIAVDAGNGMAGKIIPLIYDNLPVEIVPLYFELDGAFPNHLADPSKYENLQDLQKKVKQEGCDFGMAFDGDADRIFLVDERGEVVQSSLLSSLIVKNMLRKKKGEKIIYNLVCSKIVPDTIKKYGGVPVIERVGHSFIKETMRKTHAFFACEHSAHYYYRDNYRADSGMITSVLVAEILSKEGKQLSHLLDEFRTYHTIEETSVKVDDKEKKLKEIEETYHQEKVSKLDGVTVEGTDWWFNVRPSNTEPLLRLNLEAASEATMKNKREEVLSRLNE